ncbi:MAG TPA: SdrD B-like domain-containing protein, partial [Chitinophagaceae bacterium]|nr:SdrD B-like domain-containing protein [Chitinophagaceae bacterium]
MTKKIRIFLTILFCLGAGLSHAQSISGKVFNDANNNGVQDGAEVGYPFVVVNAYAPGSTTPTVTTATTGSPSANAGEFALAGLSAGVQYRIEFVTPTGYHDGAFSALQGHSSVQFATTGATGVNYGIRYANECTISSNPRLIGSQSLNPVNNPSANGVLKSWSYSDRVLELQSNFQSAGPFPPDDLTYTAGTGTPTGVSFDSKNKHIYFSSWAAVAAIFPAPTAGYHAIQIANYSGAGNTFVDQKTLVDLASIGLSTTALNQISSFPTNSAGTAGLGQVAVSGDGKFLYGVNLNDGSIFKLNISNVNYASLPTSAPSSGDLSSIAIPSSVPNPVGGVFRPFALKLKGNTLYIGGINDASTSLNNSNLEMVVLTMDLSTNSFTKVFSSNLNVTAGITQNGYGYAGIFGLTQGYWRDAPSVYSDFQPFFNSIEFDDYGAMLIGITNRTVYTSMSAWQGGYFVRAARNSSGGYTLENAGFSDPFTSTARGAGSGGASGDGPGNSDTYNTDGPGGKFFYENMIHDFHANVFIGGLYVLPGS